MLHSHGCLQVDVPLLGQDPPVYPLVLHENLLIAPQHDPLPPAPRFVVLKPLLELQAPLHLLAWAVMNRRGLSKVAKDFNPAVSMMRLAKVLEHSHAVATS